MKTRESGMPDEPVWESFFKPMEVLQALGLVRETERVVDFGSGYGTFSLAAARMIKGEVVGLDIEPVLIDLCRQKALEVGLRNARFECRDFVANGTGLPADSASYVMLFNILHAEQPEILLREAHRILAPDGLLAIMHWNYDEKTPRGPSMTIRPRPEDCRNWVELFGFADVRPCIDLPPWHYGFTAKARNNNAIKS
jgi:SAM-dependent methyltransferase